MVQYCPMTLRLFVGTVGVICLALGCDKGDVAAPASTDAGPNDLVDAGTNSSSSDAGDAAVDELVGGTYPLTSDQLQQIRDSACSGSEDAGVLRATAAGDADCAYPAPVADPTTSTVTDPRRIAVVVRLSSGEAMLIGRSASDCSQGDGWYMNAGTNIVLCPKTCATVGSSSANTLQIYGGCGDFGSACMLC
jgi:hypothetical protein